MTEFTHEKALAHFGKKGMRWGVRNDDSGFISVRNHTSSVSAKDSSSKSVRGRIAALAVLGVVGAILLDDLDLGSHTEVRKTGPDITEIPRKVIAERARRITFH